MQAVIRIIQGQDQLEKLLDQEYKLLDQEYKAQQAGLPRQILSWGWGQGSYGWDKHETQVIGDHYRRINLEFCNTYQPSSKGDTHSPSAMLQSL